MTENFTFKLFIRQPKMTLSFAFSVSPMAGFVSLKTKPTFFGNFLLKLAVCVSGKPLSDRVFKILFGEEGVLLSVRDR